MRRLIAILFSAATLVAGANAFGQSADNDGEACSDIWEAIGLPETEDDIEQPDVVCHLGYVLGHNRTARIPDWVVERLTREIASGTNTRPGSGFRVERNLPEGTPRAVNDDYTNSGYDRGHQAPSNDFKSSSELMEDTFFFSNVVPQVGLGFNQGIWKDFEALVLKLAINRGEIYIITGPIYRQGGTVRVRPDADACRASFELPNPQDVEIGSGVAVPIALYKVIYDPGWPKVNAYLLPNRDHREIQDTPKDIEYLKRYRVGLGTVEKLTGLTFLAALDERTRRILTEECPETMLR